MFFNVAFLLLLISLSQSPRRSGRACQSRTWTSTSSSTSGSRNPRVGRGAPVSRLLQEELPERTHPVAIPASVGARLSGDLFRGRADTLRFLVAIPASVGARLSVDRLGSVRSLPRPVAIPASVGARLSVEAGTAALRLLTGPSQSPRRSGRACQRVVPAAAHLDCRVPVAIPASVGARLSVFNVLFLLLLVSVASQSPRRSGRACQMVNLIYGQHDFGDVSQSPRRSGRACQWRFSSSWCPWRVCRNPRVGRGAPVRSTSGRSVVINLRPVAIPASVGARLSGEHGEGRAGASVPGRNPRVGRGAPVSWRADRSSTSGSSPSRNPRVGRGAPVRRLWWCSWWRRRRRRNPRVGRGAPVSSGSRAAERRKPSWSRNPRVGRGAPVSWVEFRSWALGLMEVAIPASVGARLSVFNVLFLLLLVSTSQSPRRSGRACQSRARLPSSRTFSGRRNPRVGRGAPVS